MTTQRFGERVTFVLLAATLIIVPLASSMADTSAAAYHWARKRPQFTLKVGANVSREWNSYLRRAIADWNANDTVILDKVTGRTNPRKCRPNKGRVEVCSWRYGTQVGWLGLTQLYFNTRGDHIEAVTVQLNDSFLFARKGEYSRDSVRRHTICHELGHTMGLEGHQDSQSCMNDSQHAVFNYVTPIRTDLRELAQMYGHKDGPTMVSKASMASQEFVAQGSIPSVTNQWLAGETVTTQKLDDGRTVVTFLIWAKD